MPATLVGASWDEAFRTFTRSAWRLEAQGVYREPYERQPLIDFLAGQDPDLSFMDEWIADVHADVAAGKTYGRVRVLTEPLTDYLRFELSFTQLNIDAGEEVRVLPMRRFTELEVPQVDFWLFDDARAAVMHLDENGFAYADLVTDEPEITRFREIREVAWQNAIPFSEYLSNR